MMNISPVDRCADHGRVAEYGRVIHGGFAPYNIFFDSRHNASILSQLQTLFQRTCGGGLSSVFSDSSRLVLQDGKRKTVVVSGLGIGDLRLRLLELCLTEFHDRA